MIKFIIVTFCIIIFMRMVAPALLRLLITYLFKKTMSGGFGAPQQSYGRPQQPYTTGNTRPNGKVKIDYVPESHTNGRKDFTGGEYVDYEEVK